MAILVDGVMLGATSTHYLWLVMSLASCALLLEMFAFISRQNEVGEEVEEEEHEKTE